jgi:hypothetical protein
MKDSDPYLNSYSYFERNWKHFYTTIQWIQIKAKRCYFGKLVLSFKRTTRSDHPSRLVEWMKPLQVGRVDEEVKK